MEMVFAQIILFIDDLRVEFIQFVNTCLQTHRQQLDKHNCYISALLDFQKYNINCLIEVLCLRETIIRVSRRWMSENQIKPNS